MAKGLRVRKTNMIALLREARDLLYHEGSHKRGPGVDDPYPPCAACDLEARIDAVTGR